MASTVHVVLQICAFMETGLWFLPDARRGVSGTPQSSVEFARVAIWTTTQVAGIPQSILALIITTVVAEAVGVLLPLAILPTM
jgi:hypothetical protein